MRWLFVKTRLTWPRTSGHDLRTYNLARSLATDGEDVELLTVHEPSPEARGELRLYAPAGFQPAPPPPARWLQRKFTSYWGTDTVTAAAVHEWQAQGGGVVVGVGLDSLPYLAAVRDHLRVWYAGDEWITHHLSLLKRDRDTWQHVRHAALKGLYERAFNSCVDLVWVVAPSEVGPMERLAGMARVDVIANGVDHEYYADTGAQPVPGRVIFWGRLDFEPNEQALEWFISNIWPGIIGQVPHATFQVVGRSPSPRVRALTASPGIELREDVPDLRPNVSTSSVVVLPMRSGGGIKNKLLEAAAMERPIVCTPLALGGLRGTPPAEVAATPDEWTTAVVSLLSSPGEASLRGRALREWVVREHSWHRAAQEARDSTLAALRARC